VTIDQAWIKKEDMSEGRAMGSGRRRWGTGRTPLDMGSARFMVVSIYMNMAERPIDDLWCTVSLNHK
jgi:hypothetical protein